MAKVVIAAGGTAGHVVPALAVADVLRGRGVEVEFIGGDRAEAELVPAAGYPFHQLQVAGIDRSNVLRAARALLLAAGATFRARRLLKRAGADAVMGGGGYVAGPVGLAARSLRLPIVLTEADSHLGVTNRLLAPLAARVCLAFPVPGRDGSRYLLTGRPLPAATGGTDRAARPRALRARPGRGVPARLRRIARRAPPQPRGSRCLRVRGAVLGAARLRPSRLRRAAGAARGARLAAALPAAARTSSRSPTRSRPPTWWPRARAARCSSWRPSGCRRSSCRIRTRRPTTRP